MVLGKRRSIGLGAYPEVSLAQARAAARKHRAIIRDGIDPIEARKAARSAAMAERGGLTFAEAARRCVDAKAAGKSDGSLHQWRSTLEAHAFPIIGKVPVRDIELKHLLLVLEPLWTTTTETASRLRGRIESVLAWATVHKHRAGDNPARWRGNLDQVLPSPRKVARVEHHAALPWKHIGEFMVRLRAQQGMGAQALQFAILTAARSGEVRGATWAELDLEAALWTVPAARMKAGREHRVPLSAAALDVLRAQPTREGLVFPSTKGTALSDMTLSAVLRRMDIKATVHGFRSTFRDWMAEATNYPNAMGELALAHVVSNEVEAAYRRGDMFEKRRALMEDWARFCCSVSATATDQPILDSAVGE
jgi:integrase